MWTISSVSILICVCPYTFYFTKEEMNIAVIYQHTLSMLNCLILFVTLLHHETYWLNFSKRSTFWYEKKWRDEQHVNESSEGASRKLFDFCALVGWNRFKGLINTAHVFASVVTYTFSFIWTYISQPKWYIFRVNKKKFPWEHH